MDDFHLAPAQGLQILAVAEMLRTGELTLCGEQASMAEAVLIDVSQEIALQIDAGEPPLDLTV